MVPASAAAATAATPTAAGDVWLRSRLWRTWRPRRAAVVTHAFFGPVLFLFPPAAGAAAAARPAGAPGGMSAAAARGRGGAGGARRPAAPRPLPADKEGEVDLGRSVMVVLADAAVRLRPGRPGAPSGWAVVTGRRTYVFRSADAGGAAYWVRALGGGEGRGC